MINNTICAQKFGKSVYAGAVNLKKHVKEINDLNVFPIPDGDTGDNMLLSLSVKNFAIIVYRKNNFFWIITLWNTNILL